MHNPNVILMGGTQSSSRESTNKQSVSGVVMAAGLALILESSDKVSVDTSEGGLIGVSLGRDLSDTDKTAICRKGLRVPVQLKAGYDPAIGEVCAIEDDTGLARAYTGSGDRYVNAVFSSARIGGTGVTGGVAEGATTEVGTVGVALIDFPGGL